MANGHQSQIPAEERARRGQTTYKRQLAYQSLGIDPKDVERIAFLQTDMKRMARLLSRGPADSPRTRPLDLLQCSDEPEGRKVLQKYYSVPESYRRLLPVEAFCLEHDGANVEAIRPHRTYCSAARRGRALRAGFSG